MYKKNKMEKTSIAINKSYEGETIEKKIRRITNNKEPITDGAPLIYTDRKDGVESQYNIKTDRWEVAIDAMDYVAKSHEAKRMERIKERESTNKEEKNGEAEPIQTTE